MMARLGDLGKVITGNTPKTSNSKNYESNDICFVKPSDIADGEITHLKASEFYISEYAREKARILPPKSILVTCIGIIGKVAINTTECAFNQQINAIIPDPQKCVVKYLAYAIQAKQQIMQDTANAPIVPILNKTQFSEIEVKVPSIAQQQHIATILDKVSNLITLRKQQLDKLDELVKARFVEMFGDPIVNPMKWPLTPLLEMGDCKNGMNFHNGDSGIEIYCLGVGDFKELSAIHDTSKLSKVSLNEMPNNDYLLKNEDIVFVRSNGNKALVGRCLAVYPGDTLTTFSGFCIRYRRHSEIIQTDYLLQVLKSNSIREKMAGRGVNIQNLNQQILASLAIPVPPQKLQGQFALFVNQIEKTRLTIWQGLDKLEEMKKALMQEYFG